MTQPIGLSSGAAERGRFYRPLEKTKAGLGAAGITAILIEALVAKSFAGSMSGETHVFLHVFIALAAALAFYGAARVVDVPEKASDDADR